MKISAIDALKGNRSDCAVALLYVAFASLAAGLIIYAFISGTPLRYGDEREYLQIAENIEEGRGYTLNGSPTAFRPPVWPIVLAAFLKLGLPASHLAVVPAVIMIAAAAVAAILGVKLSHSKLGALAGVAILAYPLNIYTAVRLYPQALATLFVLILWLTAVVISTDTSTDRTRPWGYLLIGTMASLLALSVPTLAATGLIVVVWSVYNARVSRARASLFAAFGFGSPIAAWTIRNFVEFGTPVLISTSSGLNLLIGNNHNATGNSGFAVDIAGPIASSDHLDEVGRDTLLRQYAIDWMVDNPRASFTLYIEKVLNYFAPYNPPATASESASAQQWISYVVFTLVLSLLAARLLLRHRLPLIRAEILFLWLFVVNAPLMAVFFTRTRFRQPLDSVLLVEATLGALLLAHQLSAQRKRRSQSYEPP